MAGASVLNLLPFLKGKERAALAGGQGLSFQGVLVENFVLQRKK